jgi:drug/metabolite transporter (DMT)-like permease
MKIDELPGSPIIVASPVQDKTLHASSRTPSGAPPAGCAARARWAWRSASYTSLLADGALLVVALIWGATFVMVKDAVTAYPVFSFLALRFAFAAVALLPVVLLRRSRRRVETPRGRAAPPFGVILGGPTPSTPQRSQDSEGDRTVGHGDSSLESRRRGIWLQNPLRVTVGLAASLLMGIALFAGYALQTFGLQLTTPAKAGFVTGLSVVMVPVVATLALHQKLGRGAWLGVGLATAGLALLTLNAGFSVNPGDVLVFGCAAAFACQILLTGRFAPRFDPLLLTFGQIVVVALLAAAAALVVERPAIPTGSVLFAAAFTGILATSLAFGVQTVAQRFTSSTRTALIFATEPIFAALFSFLLIGEVLGLRQLAGCGLILAGMVLAEVMRDDRTDTGGGDE